MAGGVNAAIVPCMRCAGAAHRTSEGLENDYYKCEECGYGFGIDWSYEGPPREPCWPISEEEARERRAMADRVFNTILKDKSADLKGRTEEQNGERLQNPEVESDTAHGSGRASGTEAIDRGSGKQKEGGGKYRVLVDSNEEYMDKSARYIAGCYDDCAAAIAKCKYIVDQFLLSSYREGMTAEHLLMTYKFYGEDPWVSSGDESCTFSAWTYAAERCWEICGSK